MRSVILDMRLVFLAIILAMLTQTLTTYLPFYAMADSFIAMSAMVFLSLVAKKYLPSSLPTFAYTTIIGIIICLPDTIIRTFFLDAINKISFLSCCVPLLAFSGLSIGGKIEELREMSWKVVVIFLVVSTLCFFGAALVAQIGFDITGVI